METLKLRKEEVGDQLGWLEREALTEERSSGRINGARTSFHPCLDGLLRSKVDDSV